MGSIFTEKRNKLEESKTTTIMGYKENFEIYRFIDDQNLMSTNLLLTELTKKKLMTTMVSTTLNK